MARPRKEGMDYFPHDTDAANDEKIEALRSLYGNDGYAFYFILLERIYRTNGAELDISKSILLAPIAAKVGVTKERFMDMLRDSLDLELFSKVDYEKRGVITSAGVKRRFSEVNNMRKRWRKHKENDEENGVFSGVFHAENGVENRVENDADNKFSTRKTGWKTGFSPGFSTRKTGEETRESKANIKAKENIKENAVVITATATENPFAFYENNIAVSIPAVVREQIADWSDELGDDLVVEAMRRAAESNKRHWRYINSILISWKEKGIRTIEQVRAEQAEFERMKQKPATPKKTEQYDEPAKSLYDPWLLEDDE